MALKKKPIESASDHNYMETSTDDILVTNVWTFLRRPGYLAPKDTWPCLNIHSFPDKLVLTVPDSSTSPLVSSNWN